MSEWKEVRLQEVTDIIGDGIHGTPSYDNNGEYYFINGSNLCDGKIVINNDTKRVNYEDFLKHKKELNQNTILISINGTIGNTALYQGEKCILGKSACYINVNHLYDKYFIYYILSSRKFSRSISFQANGTTIKNVSLKQIREYSFFIPSTYEDQKDISSILRHIDAKIETNNKLNEKLEEMAQAIFKSWFVDFEPFKNQPFYETELGMIPEGWEIINLKEIVEENPKSKIKVSDARDNKGPYPFFTSGKSILRYDDYLVDNFNVFLNTGGVADIKFYIGKANYSTDTWCIRGKEKCSTFLFYYLKNILEEINFKYFEGSALKHLQKKKLLERKIIFPSTYIMKEYLEIVNPLLIQQSMQSKQSQRLASLRDTLLPRLMSGEIKI